MMSSKEKKWYYLQTLMLVTFGAKCHEDTCKVDGDVYACIENM